MDFFFRKKAKLRQLMQVTHHADGSVTIGTGHAIQLAFLTRYSNHFSQLTQHLETTKTILPERKIEAFRAIINAALDDPNPGAFIEDKVYKESLFPIEDEAYRTELIRQAKALTEAFKSIQTAINMQLTSQGGFIKILGVDKDILEKLSDTPAAEKTGLGPAQRKLSEELLADSLADAKKQTKHLNRNGITLPKQQADALFKASDIIKAVAMQEILSSALKGDTRAVKNNMDCATSMLMNATYIDTTLQGRQR